MSRVLIVIIAAVAFLAAVGLSKPPGPRSPRLFDPDRMANLETRMWQAYYQKQRVRLFALLVTQLREQYRYPWLKAVRAGYHLARAAATFGDMRSDYERVLPDLECSFTIARMWTGARFQPAEVARAELAWWVARRVPRENDPENVGRLIARSYALLYEVPQARVEEAALLRARAAALRDRGGAHADWAAVSDLLRRSYRSLKAGLGAPDDRTAGAEIAVARRR
jgi:hypothetical protein